MCSGLYLVNFFFLLYLLAHVGYEGAESAADEADEGGLREIPCLEAEER